MMINTLAASISSLRILHSKYCIQLGQYTHFYGLFPVDSWKTVVRLTYSLEFYVEFFVCFIKDTR